MIKQIGVSAVIVCLVWGSVASLHFLASYSDAFKYNANTVLDFSTYRYYLLAYSGWGIVSIISYSLIKTDRWGTFPLRISATGLFLLVWVILYFYYDHMAQSLIFNSTVLPLSTVLKNTPHALFFLYTLMSLLTFSVCLLIVMHQRRKAQTLQIMLEKQLAAEFERDLAQQKLKLLQSQLSSHFLFNCLSAISALVRTNNKSVLLTSLNRIASLLRHAIHASQQHCVPAHDELQFLDDYIALQSLRFSERFVYQSQIKMQTDIEIPPLLLQPLLENAFEHAVSVTTERVNIRLSAIEKSNGLHIKIVNSLPSHLPSNEHKSGLGSSHQNIRQRLALMYGETAQFNADISEGAYTVSLILPILKESYLA